MREYIGLSLHDVLKDFVNKEYKIIYNTNNQDDEDKLYVTNITVKEGIYFIVVSDFKIEVM